jgi:hypothetical protein
MPPQAQPSIRELITKAVDDAKRLATAQMELAKTEMSASGQQAGMGAGLGIATLGIAVFAILFLLVTLALVIVQLGLQPWAGFLIVAVLLLITGAITGLLARRSLQAAKPPTLAIAEFEKTKAALAGSPIATPPSIATASPVTSATPVAQPPRPGA